MVLVGNPVNGLFPASLLKTASTDTLPIANLIELISYLDAGAHSKQTLL
jgi:hypothetical protein